MEAVKRVQYSDTQTMSWGTVGTPMNAASKGANEVSAEGKPGIVPLARNPTRFTLLKSSCEPPAIQYESAWQSVLVHA